MNDPNMNVTQEMINDVKMSLARVKESFDGNKWEKKPALDDVRCPGWSKKTWAMFDELPVLEVEDVLKPYDWLEYDRNGKIGQIYQKLWELEEKLGPSFEDVLKKTYGIEETRCLCSCCGHSGKCPMENFYKTTYGTFVIGCRFFSNTTTENNRKTGKWVDGSRKKFDGTDYFFRKCSVCGYERNDCDTLADTNFCPNCGAAMEKGISES